MREKFYQDLYEVKDISDIKIDRDEENLISGRYIYRELKFGFFEANLPNSGFNIFTNILKISFDINYSNSKRNSFIQKLREFLEREVNDIPTLRTSYKLNKESNEIYFELINDIAFNNEIKVSSRNIILPMLDLLFLARTKILLFIIEFKNNN
ncbi:hypothetical protein F480_04715 [Bibersteinia trehalosi Y31]|uniref:Uncharacterized protein n=1 Tax=Bibersteinia trehalosi Y31 TaxID=1261658 RepID=A0A179CY94_BIBTR|nr:hypothetical protein [Bibersteinia trehalosi]OAQ14884.1 hypothetical protein F480_04715 [Bibersteinia trehalosi Y31]